MGWRLRIGQVNGGQLDTASPGREGADGCVDARYVPQRRDRSTNNWVTLEQRGRHIRRQTGKLVTCACHQTVVKRLVVTLLSPVHVAHVVLDLDKRETMGSGQRNIVAIGETVLPGSIYLLFKVFI